MAAGVGGGEERERRKAESRFSDIGPAIFRDLPLTTATARVHQFSGYHLEDF
jgi:hypothetical protein